MRTLALITLLCLGPEMVAEAEPTQPGGDWTLAALMSFRFSGAPFAVGGGVAVRRRLAGPFVAALDVVRDQGDEGRPLGELDTNTVSAGARLGAVVRLDRVELEVTLGCRFGVATLSGITGANSPPATQGRSMTAAWGGPTLSAFARSSPGKLALIAGVEGGYAVLGAEAMADGRVTSSLTGAWLAASVAVSVRL